MKNSLMRSNCPVSSALDIFGDKWSLLIIRDIALFGKNTYNDFLKSDEKISTNILADRLVLLEKEGIIVQEAHPQSKAKKLYTLSPKGIDLIPLILEISLWSDQHLNTPQPAKDFAAVYRADKDKVINQIKENLKFSKGLNLK